MRQPYNGECLSGLKCCQSGEPGTWNAATCISRPCDEWIDTSYVYINIYDPFINSIYRLNYMQYL